MKTNFQEDTEDDNSTIGEFLRTEFLKRKSKNPKFSMRSFALKIGIDQSLLSKVIQGKRNLSNESMRSCMERLHLPEEQIQVYLEKFNNEEV